MSESVRKGLLPVETWAVAVVADEDQHCHVLHQLVRQRLGLSPGAEVDGFVPPRPSFDLLWWGFDDGDRAVTCGPLRERQQPPVRYVAQH